MICALVFIIQSKMMKINRDKMNNILLGGVLLGSFLCAYNSFMGFRAIVVVFMVLLAFGSKYYLTFPIVLFFYTQFGLFAGMSILRIFSFLQILNFIVLYIEKKKAQVNYKSLTLLTIYIAYTLIVLTTEEPSLGVALLLSLISIGILALYNLSEEQKLVSFFRVYCIVAVLSIPAGLKQANSMINHQVIAGKLVEMSRFMGTFDDPNYFTFFCYIAIASLLTLKLFSRRTRISLLCIFQIGVFSTLSITGIIAGVIIWGTYLLLEHKINFGTFAVALCAVIAVIMGYNYALQHPETPVIGSLALRVGEKLSFMRMGDLSGITTGRSSYSQQHMEYFMNQSVGRILFGGNLANTKIMNVGNMRFAAHNEYIDILLNIGVVGTLVYFYCFFSRINRLFRIRRLDETRTNYCNCLLLFKVIWIIYAATLTLFLEERFLLFAII